jgi:hypothetical protein
VSPNGPRAEAARSGRARHPGLPALERSRAFLERIAGISTGLAHPNLDPDLAALAATVTRLWLNSLRIPDETATCG